MNFDIILTPPDIVPDIKTPAHLHYKHFKDGSSHSTISLCQFKCTCGRFLFSPEEYIHILEHEIIESVCKNINFEDYHTTLDPIGFNRIFSKNHMKRKIHKCHLYDVELTYG